MEFDINKILKEMESQYKEFFDELFSRKSDVEITCKITFKDLPTTYIHSSEGKQQLDTAIQQIKFNMAEIPNAKTTVKVKIKDKEPGTSKKERR